MKNQIDLEIVVTETLNDTKKKSEEDDQSNVKIKSEKLRYENADTIYE